MATATAVHDATGKFSRLTFEEKLDRLAEVAVKIGLGLREGQEMLLTAPIEALPLVLLLLLLLMLLLLLLLRAILPARAGAVCEC